jgi:prolipoprotein diacylglyceryltransferase
MERAAEGIGALGSMLNLQDWKPEHRAALAIATAAGSALGVAIGYSLLRYRSGIDRWLRDDPWDVVFWAVVGGIVAGAIVYVYRVFSN